MARLGSARLGMGVHGCPCSPSKSASLPRGKTSRGYAVGETASARSGRNSLSLGNVFFKKRKPTSDAIHTMPWKREAHAGFIYPCSSTTRGPGCRTAVVWRTWKSCWGNAGLTRFACFELKARWSLRPLLSNRQLIVCKCHISL